MISVENLCKSFGDLEILKGITENIERASTCLTMAPQAQAKVHLLAGSIIL